ncbi:MAG: HesA/MoeB/ThiF family protein [Paludibacteraceae bacterium]|nr:HesA/MoeB/ThiF family protein [Paludibacteraceae bacterium]
MSGEENILTRLSWFEQQTVTAAHVMVVGCGALGNEVLKNLALFGVGHLVLVDFDRVEASNLNRSVLFRRKDAELGRYKVEVAAGRLKELNPSIEIKTICGDIAYDVGLGLIRRMDVIVGCVDNRWARYCINRLAMRADKPWVDGGIDGLEGTARVFIPGQNCYACNLGSEGLKEIRRRFSCANTIRMNEAAGRVPTTPVIGSIIGAVQAQEAMKLIHRNKIESGELTSLCGRMFCYEGQHFTTRTVDFKAYDDDCPVHEQWTPVIESRMTNRISVREALNDLRDLLHDEQIRISLTSDCFVDKLIRKEDDCEVEVMVPKHRINGERLKVNGERLGNYYVNEFYELDAHFPYQDLTLAQVGIPQNDILLVHTNQGDRFVELKIEN